MHILLLLLLPTSSLAACRHRSRSQGEQMQPSSFSFDDMFDPKFTPKYLAGAKWLTNDRLSFSDDEGGISLFDTSSGVTSSLVSPSDYRSMNASSFSVSPDATEVLFASNSVAVYRHSSLSQFRRFNVAAASFIGIDDALPQQTAAWGADGLVAFVQEHNILISSRDGSKTRVTTDGTKEGVIRNGIPDWVYEEEVLSASGAMYFSPSGRHLAFIRFDDTDVPQFNYTYYGDVYPKTMNLRYPKPGFDNPTVQVRVYDLATQATVTMDLNAPELTAASYYVYEVDFYNASHILVRQQNRAQNIQNFALCEVSNGACALLHTEQVEGGWLCPSCGMHPVPERGSFLHVTIAPDGNQQLAEYAVEGSGSVRFLTAIDEGSVQQWEVSASSMSETSDAVVSATTDQGSGVTTVVYTRTESTPMDRHLYTLQLAPPSSPSSFAAAGELPTSTRASCDDQEGSEGTYSGLASASGKWLLCYFQGDSTFSSIPYAAVHPTMRNTTEEGWAAVLQDNRALLDALNEIGIANLPSYTYVNVPAAEEDPEDSHYGRLLLPPDFDPAKRYPVMVKIYGGPASQAVTQRFPAMSLEMYLASTGTIVAEMDGRGTDARGSAFRHAVYRRLGVLETDDQLRFGRWLADLPYVESGGGGLAMYGSSFGGFMTLMSLSASSGDDDENNPFGVGVASAPVTDWKYYDTIYTERYMGTPLGNAEGYDSGSVFPRVSGLQGKRLLLAHGTGDDNVHFQHTVELLNALIADSNTDFDLAVYPNRQHSISEDGARPHLYRVIEEHFAAHLG